MDERKDIEQSSANAASSSAGGEGAPATPVSESAPGETKVECASAETPPLASSNNDAAAVAEAKIEEPKPVEAATATLADAPSSIAAAAVASVPLSRRFALSRLSTATRLAASVVLAAALGATAGALGASGLARSGSATAAEDPQTVQAAFAQTRTEIAALKASLEAANRNASTQFAKLGARFDRLDRAQSDAGAKTNRAAESLDRLEQRTEPAPASSGAITPPAIPAAAPAQPAPAIVSGWVLHDVYRGAAILRGRLGLIEVEPGDVLPGVGRIEAIRRQDGRWVVITTKGLITSMR